MSYFPGTLGDVGLPDRLERIYPLCVLLADLHDFTEAAFPDNCEKFEGFDRQRFVAGLFEVDFKMERT